MPTSPLVPGSTWDRDAKRPGDPRAYPHSGVGETDNSDRASSWLSGQRSFVQSRLEEKLLVGVLLSAIKNVHVNPHQCRYRLSTSGKIGCRGHIPIIPVSQELETLIYLWAMFISDF
jgi:hypothetical protein